MHGFCVETFFGGSLQYLFSDTHTEPSEFPTQHSATPQLHWEDLEYIFPHLVYMLPFLFIDWIDNTMVMGNFSFPDVKTSTSFSPCHNPISIHCFKAATDFLEPPNKDLGLQQLLRVSIRQFLEAHWKGITKKYMSFQGKKKQNSYSSLLNSGTVQWTLKHNLFLFKKIFQTNKQI